MNAPLPRPAASGWIAVALAIGLGLTGCGTAPVSYKTRDDTAARIAALHAVRAAPLDISVQEISAGGLAEKHDELTELVGRNVTSALARSHQLSPTPLPADPDAEPARAELAEVQALLRAIIQNDAMPFGAAAPPSPGPRSLTYQVGRIDRLANALGGDAILFVFVRDQYSTGGRKAVMALAMIAGAAAGVAITPAMGVTASSAALVERDGTVLWFNQLGAAGLDLRSPAAAVSWVQRLTAGLPPVASGIVAPPTEPASPAAPKA